jgi:hypothetical protein
VFPNLKHALFAFCWLCLIAAVLAQDTLPPSWKELNFPVVVPPKEYAIFKMGGSYLWTFRRLLTIREQQFDAVDVHSLNDKSHTLISFWIEGAQTIQVEDVAVTHDRVALLVGSSSTAQADQDGNAKENVTTKARFLAARDFSDGTVVDVNLGPYDGAQVCEAGDGTVWVLGQDLSAEHNGRPYRLLRQFTMAGKAVGTYLDRAEIPIRNLVLSPSFQENNGSEVFRGDRVVLSCSDESVGVYIGAAQTWSEVRIKDGSTQTWNLKLPSPRAMMTGLVLLDQHVVYASFRVLSPAEALRRQLMLGNQSPPPPAALSTGEAAILRGLYILKLGREGKGSWQEVSGTISPVGTPGAFARLIGSDGENLVYVRSPSPPARRSPTIVWLKP